MVPVLELQQSDGDEDGQNYIVHPVPFSRYILDPAMPIVYIDENFEGMTGYTREDVCGMRQVDLIPEEDRTEYLCKTNAQLAKSSQVFQEHKIRRKDGSDIYVFCYGRVYFDSAARAERSEIIISDIAATRSMKMLMDAEQSKAQIRLRRWEQTYRTDPLTGLLNHAAFRSDVEKRLLQGTEQGIMLMIDVDFFKDYNDTHGHHSGDRFLILVAQTLLASVRERDYTCRMGGDEFAAMLFFGKDVDLAKMRVRVQEVFDTVNMTLRASCDRGISMGAAFANPESDFNTLYEKADEALYEAKRKGRGRLIIS